MNKQIKECFKWIFIVHIYKHFVEWQYNFEHKFALAMELIIEIEHDIDCPLDITILIERGTYLIDLRLY